MTEEELNKRDKAMPLLRDKTSSPLRDRNYPDQQFQFADRLRFASVIISIIAICLGISVIWGWYLDVAWLKSVIADRVTMKVSTALGLITGGITLLLWHYQQNKQNLAIRVVLYLLPSIAIAFCSLNLINYSFHLDLGAGWLPFPESPSTVTEELALGRMSPNTAIGFLILNTAILFLIRKYYLSSQLCIVSVLAIAFASIVGHIYSVEVFYSVGSPTGMAIHTAIGLILLSLACLGTRGERGWMRVITTEAAGGLMARWLLPLVIVTPVILGSLIWFALGNDIQAAKLAIALRITLEMFILGLIVWWTAQKLNRVDRQKQELFQRLLETESRFRAIFNQTFQFIGLLTPDGTLLEANQTALDFAGINKADVVDQPFWSAYWWQISPETQQELREAIAIASTGEFVRYRVAVQGVKGIVTIDFSLRPVKNDAGKVILIIPEGRDISQQIEMEQALQQSEARYRAIVEDQTELICRYRSDSTISYVNDAFCRYFELNSEDLIDRQYTPVVYKTDRDKVTQLVNSMNPSNPTITIENRVLAKGEIRWTQWNNRMIFDEAGNFLEYQAVGRDISHLKEIELKLRESEERFRNAFENAATGEALVSLDGNFMQVNRSLCEIVGYSETELLNRNFQSITHPEDLNLDLNYVRQLLAGTIRTYQMEKRYYHKLGHTVWVLLSVSLVKDIDNQPKYFISQIKNINQQKRAEARLNDLVTELERSNRELDEFASIVSHDLISPLRKQLILLDLVKDEYAAILDQEGQDYLTKITNFNFKMETLVRSLLIYARLTTQAKPFVPVALNDVINDVLYDLEAEIVQSQATIEVEELPTIKGDRFQLHQLFLNLLQNALKFRFQERSPEIQITCRLKDNFYQIARQPVARVRCGQALSRVEGTVEVAIADNGIGFEPEQQQKIFTPFHRLHSYSKYIGTGLGLAICKKIVERHQGKISAQSKLGQGTTFTIFLPSNTLSN